MKARDLVDRVLDVLGSPSMMTGLLSWPKFSFSSYRVVERLVRQGVTVNTVIDVGANVGQFSVAAAKLMKPKSIFAFEPAPAAFERLKRNTRALPEVRAMCMALGERDGVSEFNVNVHLHSSSILKLAAAHEQAFPNAIETEVIRVPMMRLDGAIEGKTKERPCLLKLDVQGYEANVLLGATETLAGTDYVVAELSFKPMYQGERTFADMLELFEEKGFRFSRPLDFLADPKTGEFLQMDGLFVRVEA